MKILTDREYSAILDDLKRLHDYVSCLKNDPNVIQLKDHIMWWDEPRTIPGLYSRVSAIEEHLGVKVEIRPGTSPKLIARKIKKSKS
jgi:hypothetical protein